MSLRIVEGGITAPKGFTASGVHSGVKRRSLDLGLLVSEVPARAFCAYTSNNVKAAPVRLMMETDPEFLSAVVVNSGNANALTGQRGMSDAMEMRDVTAWALGLDPREVGLMSTGVIGRFLDMEKITRGIGSAVNSLGAGPDADDDLAHAIMTTDTVKKECSAAVTLSDGTEVRISAVSKGSGMIEPRMKALHATTLSLVTTDAVLSEGFRGTWQSVLDDTINMVSVDGDQSTNDTCMLLANGMAGGICADGDPDFIEGLRAIMTAIARLIASDGEGATKMIEVSVSGAESREDARTLVKEVVNSPLVKSAVFGSDPNPGRIMMALGNSGVLFAEDSLCLKVLGGGREVTIVDSGIPVCHEPWILDELRGVMDSKEVGISLYLGVGEHSAVGWGCDLTYDYVRINAEYTT